MKIKSFIGLVVCLAGFVVASCSAPPATEAIKVTSRSLEYSATYGDGSKEPVKLDLATTGVPAIDTILGAEAILGWDENFLADSYKNGERLFQSCQFQVSFNRGSVLQVIYSVEATGAYPQSFTYVRTIDVKAKKALGFAEVFTVAAQEKVRTRIAEAFAQYQAETITRLKANPDADQAAIDLFQQYELPSALVDNFYLDAKGLSFHLNFDELPHVILGLLGEDRIISWSWAELKDLVVAGSSFQASMP